jgi:hypothetical protein
MTVRKPPTRPVDRRSGELSHGAFLRQPADRDGPSIIIVLVGVAMKGLRSRNIPRSSADPGTRPLREHDRRRSL